MPKLLLLVLALFSLCVVSSNRDKNLHLRLPNQSNLLAFRSCNPRSNRPIIDRCWPFTRERSANENAPKFNSQPHGNNELRLVGKTALAGIQVAVRFVQFGIAGSLFL